MVAYSFKKQFAEPILAGTKRQTIRAARRRHARVGEALQLYTGMRTKQCRLIARAECTHVHPITLDFDNAEVRVPWAIFSGPVALDVFAASDGFDSWDDLCAFWKREHGSLDKFEGVLIAWRPAHADPTKSIVTEE